MSNLFFHRPTAARCGALLAVALFLSVPSRGVAGYLSAVGPAPLRFAPVMTALFPEALLPLPEPIPPAPLETNAMAQPTAFDTNSPPAPLITTVESPLPEFDWAMPFGRLEPSAPAAETPNALPAPVTPQAMMPFFHRRTDPSDKRQTAVWGTVVFTPPMPASRPGGKATYSTP